MVEDNTPEEIEEASDWPDIALLVTEEGKTLEPGDDGYSKPEATRRIRREIKELEEEIEALRVLSGRINQKIAESVPPISSRDAARASIANEQRARLARDSQKQQLMERLSEMGLLPE